MLCEKAWMSVFTFFLGANIVPKIFAKLHPFPQGVQEEAN
jgi:hypothetical protein